MHAQHRYLKHAAAVVLSGLMALAPGAAVAQTPTPPVPSMQVDPDQTGATPHWTLTLLAPYCGGFRIGDGVYVRAEAPLNLPTSAPDGSILFVGRPASVSLTASGDTLRIQPAPGTLWSQVCAAGERSFTVEFTPDAGLMLPDQPGTYAVDVWTGADPTVQSLAIDVPPSADLPAAGDA